jgi:ABC-type branched-subunit amino acid transport system ATPase component
VLFRVDELTVRFGGLTAVNNVSFGVEEGRFVGLIGPNGAGKTTFIDAVTGFVPSRGAVTFADKRIERFSPHHRARLGLARTFQSLELFEDLTIRENLLVGAEEPRWWSPVADLIAPRAAATSRESVEEAAELLELTDRLDLLPGDLSLGQRKLVTVARALSMRPRLLLLDEPAAGLDADESVELGRKLRSVIDLGITILLVDHDMGLVLSVCDDIHVLDFGKHIASGTPAEIRKNEAVVGAYLGHDAIEKIRAGAPA